MIYAQGMGQASGIIGVMADSHGKNGLLAEAIGTLRSLGAQTLIHLGDMCDTLAPHLMEETFRILAGNGVKGIRGNNECQIMHDMNSARSDNNLSTAPPVLEELPYVMSLGRVWFTHSVPYGFPAATRRPISEYLAPLLEDPDVPFSILFRGHSHRPSILKISGRSVEKLPVEMDRDIRLDADLRHVITVGAVEKASCVLFRPDESLVRFVTMPGR